MTFFLQAYHWPGNIRELKNRIQRAVLTTDNSWIGQEDMDISLNSLELNIFRHELSLKEAKAKFEAFKVAEALRLSEGDVFKAAEKLKISPSAMYGLIKKYNTKETIQDNTQYNFNTKFNQNANN
jgi:two-component system, NtrC family, response regulator